MTGERALIEAGASSLPVDMAAVGGYFGIKVVDYDSFIKVYRLDKRELYSRVSFAGFSLLEEGRYLCVLNSGLCGKPRRRWTTAHEFGHILCGHIAGGESPLPQQEQEADRFAAGLLAPLTALHFCGVSSALEIERLCGISQQAAQVRFRELSRLRRVDEERFSNARRRGEEPPESVFLSGEEDRELFRRFAPFIAWYIARRCTHDGYERYLEARSREGMAI